MIFIYNLTKTIDISIIKLNIATLQRVSGYNKIMFIAKADCYGLGISLTKYIEETVDYFGVATLEEGIELREIGITKPILIFLSHIDEVQSYLDYDLTANFCKLNDLIQADKIAKYNNKILKIHIPVDSGMNRFGIKSIATFTDTVEKSVFLLNIDIDGVYTHYQSTNFVNISYQTKLFTRYVDIIKRIYPRVVCHSASSQYVDNELIKSNLFDMARIGIGAFTAILGLTNECMSIYGNILEIKNLGIGENLGYNYGYIADKNMTIAVVGGGYFDGILNAFGGFDTIVNGKYAKIIGKVCMDVCFLDITNINAKIGDKVIFVEGENSLKKLSNHTKLSEYELLTGFKGRINSIYINF